MHPCRRTERQPVFPRALRASCPTTLSLVMYSQQLSRDTAVRWIITIESADFACAEIAGGHASVRVCLAGILRER